MTLSSPTMPTYDESQYCYYTYIIHTLYYAHNKSSDPGLHKPLISGSSPDPKGRIPLGTSRQTLYEVDTKRPWASRRTLTFKSVADYG